MQDFAPHPGFATFAWRLGATFVFVLANGFFVAAEFALVKVRATQLHAMAEAGSRRAKLAYHIQRRMDRYLSACQLGITISSLILGWLAEPAVAELLLVGVSASGWEISPTNPVVHAVALGIALSVITALHMIVGEQAPKIWAINRAQATTLAVAYPLQIFERIFRPFIWAINELSNGLLRVTGISLAERSEASHSVEELRSILSASAAAGHISAGQLELAENVFRIVGMEVRHILVPRVDVTFLSTQKTADENLGIIVRSGHSRFPLCGEGLDDVIGIVHAKDVMGAMTDQKALDLQALARAPLFVSDTQPLSRLIVRMQETASHCAVVVNEHGTAVGLAFLEDALEEIVGPIRDEFDPGPAQAKELGDGAVEVPGSLALPEVVERFDLPELGRAADTIGGHVVAALGRLPRNGDQLEIGGFRVTVLEVARRRVRRLLFEPKRKSASAAGSPAHTDG